MSYILLCDKISDKKLFDEWRVYSGFQFWEMFYIMAGKVWQQEQKAAGHNPLQLARKDRMNTKWHGLSQILPLVISFI